MSYVALTHRDGVATVTLDRPQRRNAVGPALLDDLLDALDRLGDPRAVVLRGAGPSFCAGQDLKEPSSGHAEAEARRYLERLQEVPRRLRALDVGVVAAVQGHALGAGLEFALACDLVVVAPDAQLGLPEVEVGLGIGGGATALLPRMLGPARANELALLGRRVTGTEAVALGLATTVADDPDTQAHRLAAELSGRPPLALAWAKRCLRRGADLEAAYALEVEAMLATGARASELAPTAGAA